jgi:hypothetical protein
MASLSEQSPHSVQVQTGMVDGQFASAAYFTLCAGPPRLSNINGPTYLAAAIAAGGAADNLAYPIGLTQQFSLSQSMNLQQLFEIGSYRQYFIPGHVVTQASMARPWFHGMSLLRTLYAYYQDLIPPTVVPAAFANIGSALVANPHDVVVPPGYENLYLNLGSDLFKQPIGLLFIARDSNEDMLGAGYCEQTYLPQHSIALSAGGVTINEQVGLRMERMLPIAGIDVIPLRS